MICFNRHILINDPLQMYCRSHSLMQRLNIPQLRSRTDPNCHPTRLTISITKYSLNILARRRWCLRQCGTSSMICTVVIFLWPILRLMYDSKNHSSLRSGRAGSWNSRGIPFRAYVLTSSNHPTQIRRCPISQAFQASSHRIQLCQIFDSTALGSSMQNSWIIELSLLSWDQ